MNKRRSIGIGAAIAPVNHGRIGLHLAEVGIDGRVQREVGT
jgi:hypothetical protein